MSRRIVHVGAWCSSVAAITSCFGCSTGDDPAGPEARAGARPDAAAATASAPQAAVGSGSIAAQVTRVKAALPQARIYTQGDRVRRLYGAVASGKSPRAAAETFRREGAHLFGVEPNELIPRGFGGSKTVAGAAPANPNGVGLMYDPATGKHKFRLFSYRQERDGVPVFRAGLRTLVRDDGKNPVVWANSDLKPMGTFRAQPQRAVASVDVDKSLAALQASTALARQNLPAPSGLTQVSIPTLTVFAGVDGKETAPRLALEYTAEAASGPGKWTFVADADSGDILHVESNLHFDITGTVQAEVTLGSESMECGTLGTAPLPYAAVTSSAGNALTDSSGVFTIVQSGSAPVNVTSSVTGQYFIVTNAAGSNASLTQSVTPPGPANFLHEDTAVPPELVLAQLNAYQQANAIRDMLLGYVPEYPVIAGQTNFPVNVNLTDPLCDATGGAWYDNDSAIRSINFCQSMAERANAAFGSIVHHEYGHHMIDAGGSGQEEYGEGMADTVAMLFAKDPRIGVGYYLNQCDTPLRNGDRDCQYSATDCSSCGPSPYECGALISGTVWDIWQELAITEPEDADDIIRSLVFSSIPLHTGNGIDASIAIDLLTLDDDDELIENGTPHYDEICTGFELHGMSCPALVDGLVIKGTDLDAEGPSDGPFEPASISYTLHNVGPEETLTYSVSIPPEATWLSVDSTGGTIALGAQTTVTVSIDQAAAAALPDGDYSAVIDFVNETSGAGNVSRWATLRVGAPEPIYTATFDAGLEGFVVDDEFQNLWHRSTMCLDALPGHSSPGYLFYGRDDLCNYNTGTPVRHTITGPAIAIPNPEMAELSFNYYLDTEDSATYDNAEVLVSVAGGPFQVVASNNSGGALLNETTSWEAFELEIADLLPPSGPSSIRIQLAFNAGDVNDNIGAGFAIDDLTVSVKPQSCSSNADCDDTLLCNGSETCVDQACLPGTPLVCDDADECTTDSCDDATGCVYEPNQACNLTPAFVEENGMVVFEAEHFMENTPRSNHTWNLASNGLASGQALMLSAPNNGATLDAGYPNTSPELTFTVDFSTTGTYYVWIRGIGPNANDDSCHLGLDGAMVASADRITGFTSGLSWTRNTMDGPIATLQVNQAGLHDINLWMREDGFSADKIVLTTNPFFRPFGNGPAESDIEGPPIARPCDDVCDNPVVFTSNNHQSGNLGTAASCHETTAVLNGGVCGNLVAPRQLFVNGVAMTCDWTPWSSLPPAVNGGYCITTTSGDHPWAAFATW